MGLFTKLFGLNKNPESYAFRLERARSLHGQAVKYVTEHRNDNEDVIGRGGSLALHGETFIVDSSGERLFSCYVKDLEANNLMSGDGVVITGPDLLHGGTLRTITVHFVYYRR
ncbi:MAG: hypothetical protein J6V09_03470 [Clostridia bacterium]|nr:hypothetical protein [Clostridia bacterium]